MSDFESDLSSDSGDTLSLLSLDSLFSRSRSSESSSESSKSSSSSLKSSASGSSVSNSSDDNTSVSSSEHESSQGSESDPEQDLRDEINQYMYREDARNPRSPYHFHLRRILDCSEQMSPGCYQAIFRMSKEISEKIYQEICMQLPPGLSSNGKSIHPRERFLIYLFHIGHNTTQSVESYSHDISKGVIWKSIKKVNEVMFHHFVPKYLKFSTPEEAEESAKKFQDDGFGAKVIWACLDGTHILVRAPKENEDMYCNRHDTKSLNCLLLVDAFGVFRYCCSTSHGAMHDSAIFMESKLYKMLMRWKERNLPFIDAVIAGDSAFRRSLSILATPFLIAEAAADEDKRAYNELFCKVRAAIERYIGILKVVVGM